MVKFEDMWCLRGGCWPVTSAHVPLDAPGGTGRGGPPGFSLIGPPPQLEACVQTCSPERLFCPAQAGREPRDMSEWLMFLFSILLEEAGDPFWRSSVLLFKGTLSRRRWRSLSVIVCVFLWPWLIWGMRLFPGQILLATLDQFWKCCGDTYSQICSTWGDVRML